MLHALRKKTFIAGSSLRILQYCCLSLVFLSGCASSSSFQNIASRHGSEGVDDQITKLNLERYFAKMVNELCGDECKKGKCSHDSILVTDFVDVQSYLPKKAGMLMGELMRSDLSRSCGYNIIQVEFSNLFKLSENGLITLTRNPAGLQRSLYPEYSVTNCVVGTYTVTPNKLYLFARIINTSTGQIVKMTHREVDLPGN